MIEIDAREGTIVTGAIVTTIGTGGPRRTLPGITIDATEGIEGIEEIAIGATEEIAIDAIEEATEEIATDATEVKEIETTEIGMTGAEKGIETLEAIEATEEATEEEIEEATEEATEEESMTPKITKKYK